MPVDIRNLTVRELCDFADEVRASEPRTKKLRRAAYLMMMASMYLEDFGALAQLLWWSKDTEPEAQPDGKADVIEMRGPVLVE